MYLRIEEQTCKLGVHSVSKSANTSLSSTMELAATLAARDAQLAVPVAAGAPTQTDQERVNVDLRVERDDLLRRVAVLDESLEQALVSKAHLKMYRSCCICCFIFFILALVSWAVLSMMGFHRFVRLVTSRQGIHPRLSLYASCH